MFDTTQAKLVLFICTVREVVVLHGFDPATPEGKAHGRSIAAIFAPNTVEGPTDEEELDLALLKLKVAHPVLLHRGAAYARKVLEDGLS